MFSDGAGSEVELVMEGENVDLFSDGAGTEVDLVKECESADLFSDGKASEVELVKENENADLFSDGAGAEVELVKEGENADFLGDKKEEASHGASANTVKGVQLKGKIMGTFWKFIQGIGNDMEPLLNLIKAITCKRRKRYPL